MSFTTSPADREFALRVTRHGEQVVFFGEQGDNRYQGLGINNRV
jgi:hypothetical protein